jgi:hypothetical protein
MITIEEIGGEVGNRRWVGGEVGSKVAVKPPRPRAASEGRSRRGSEGGGRFRWRKKTAVEEEGRRSPTEEAYVGVTVFLIAR